MGLSKIVERQLCHHCIRAADYPFTDGEPGRPQAIRLNEAGEVWQDFVSHDVIHPGQGVIGNPQARSRGFQRYAKYQAGILVVLRTRIDAYPTYYLARVERAKEGFKVGRGCVAVPGLGGAEDIRSRGNDCRDVMLAVIPEMTEQDKSIPVEGQASVIRLMPLDSVDDALIESGQPWGDVLLEFWQRSALEEGQVSSPSIACGREVPDQIVQKRRKVVHEVASIQSETRRGFPMNLGLVEIVSALRIEFGRGDAVRVRGEELLSLNLEVVQVELRPSKPPSERSEGSNVRGHARGEADGQTDSADPTGARDTNPEARGLLP